MISTFSILLFLMFCCFFLYSIWPLLFDRINNIHKDHDMLNDLERRKLILYREIQYLDNEYFIHNINTNDYNSSRADLVREVSKIIDQISSFMPNQKI